MEAAQPLNFGKFRCLLMVIDTTQLLARVSVWCARLCAQDLAASIDTIETVVVHMKSLAESFVSAIEDPLQHACARRWLQRAQPVLRAAQPPGAPSAQAERLSRRASRGFGAVLLGAPSVQAERLSRRASRGSSSLLERQSSRSQ